MNSWRPKYLSQETFSTLLQCFVLLDIGRHYVIYMHWIAFDVSVSMQSLDPDLRHDTDCIGAPQQKWSQCDSVKLQEAHFAGL